MDSSRPRAGAQTGTNAPRQRSPAYAVVEHHIGKMRLGIANNGTFGTGFARAIEGDFFTGEPVHSCEYPSRSSVKYLFGGAFWIGAVVGKDTLVSTGAAGYESAYEFHPDRPSLGYPIYRTTTDPGSAGFEEAVSEEDYIVEYTDTLRTGVLSDYFGRPHKPLNIKVRQASYAWSYDYAEDIVLFDYQVENIGFETLKNVYMGIFVDADIGFMGQEGVIFEDDFTGFLQTIPSTCGTCPYEVHCQPGLLDRGQRRRSVGSFA